MATIIELISKDGSGKYTSIEAWWSGIPADVVATGNKYIGRMRNAGEFLVTAAINLNGKTTSDICNIRLECEAGQSFTDHPTHLDNPLDYNVAYGVGVRCTNNVGSLFNIQQRNLTITGLQVWNGGNGTSGSCFNFQSGSDGSWAENCLTKLNYSGTSSNGLACSGGNARNIMVILNSANSSGLDYNLNSGGVFESITIVRPSNITPIGGSAIKGASGNKKFTNIAAFNMFALSNRSDHTGSNYAYDKDISFGTNNKPNLVFADQFVSTVNDFRVKAGSGLINAGTKPSVDNVTTISGNRQQGASTDIGAWEYPDVLVAPTAKVTKITNTLNAVTIEGTTTGVPTSGNISILPDGSAYNNAVAQGPINLSFGTNTFTATFSNVAVGAYKTTLDIANQAYSSIGSNPVGTFYVVGATASDVVQYVDGQMFHLTANLTGNPTGGTLLLPADMSKPDGALDKLIPLTINGAVLQVNQAMSPGNYGAGILQLTNGYGTSSPQPGTLPISIIGLSGNPQMVSEENTVIPKVTSVEITPVSAIVESGGEFQFTVFVGGEDFPAQIVEWSALKGSVDSVGLYKAHSPSVDEEVTVTAKSIVDPSFSDTATILVKAKVVIIAPPPVVTEVIVTAPTNTVSDGKPVQLSFVVVGTNNPNQSVTWTPSNLVSSTGLVTVPLPASVEQVVVVRATSTDDTNRFVECTITIPARSTTVPVPEVPVPNGKATIASIEMVSPEGVKQSNLTNLSCVFFDQTDVGDLLAPVARTKLGTTDAEGKLVMNITGTTLVPGQLGRIIVGKGTKAFTGVVVVN